MCNTTSYEKQCTGEEEKKKPFTTYSFIFPLFCHFAVLCTQPARSLLAYVHLCSDALQCNEMQLRSTKQLR